MISVFFDTEFSHLEFRFHQEAKLMSAGFVSEDGKEHYFELTDTYKKSECSHFVIETVLPNFNTLKFGKTQKTAALELKAWIEAFNCPVQMKSNAPNYDWPFVMDLLLAHDCWPINLDGKAVHAGNYLIDERIERYFEYQPMAIRHHALWDARALYQACKGAISD